MYEVIEMTRGVVSRGLEACILVLMDGSVRVERSA